MPFRGLCASILLTLALASSGCVPTVLDLDWRLHFDSAADEDSTRVVEVCIVEGECPAAPVRCDDGARTRYRETFPYAGDVAPPPGTMRPPQLARGRYAFVARARDATCAIVASGCIEVDVPQTSALVTLLSETRPIADCCGSACVMGECATSDTGPLCSDDDGDPCTVPGCDASGACVLTNLNDGTPCPSGDPIACNDQRCMGGVCTVMPAFENALCPTGDPIPCNEERCRGGVCMVMPAFDTMTCPDLDGNACTESRCAAGTCASLPINENGDCTGPDTTPCLDAVCRGGSCVEARAAAFGVPCGADFEACTYDFCDGGGSCIHPAMPDDGTCGDERHRCCGGVCRDIYTSHEHCGGCGNACAAGLNCRNTLGTPRGSTCDCNRDMDCPGTSGAWNCNGTMPGHCVCGSSVACSSAQSCESTPRGNLCVYP